MAQKTFVVGCTYLTHECFCDKFILQIGSTIKHDFTNRLMSLQNGIVNSIRKI